MPLHPTSRPMGAGLGEGWGMAGVLPPLGNGPRGSPVWYVNRQLAERPPFGDRPHGWQRVQNTLIFHKIKAGNVF